MTELAQPPERFRVIARGALRNDHMQGALDLATARLRGNRLAAWDALPEVEALRQQGHDARMRVIRDLDAHVERFREAVEARGGHVRFARTADEASSYVADVCRRRSVWGRPPASACNRSRLELITPPRRDTLGGPAVLRRPGRGAR